MKMQKNDDVQNDVQKWKILGGRDFDILKNLEIEYSPTNKLFVPSIKAIFKQIVDGNKHVKTNNLKI